jgi:dihydropteroate synthase
MDGIPKLMGVVNVTPDSFSESGELYAAADAIARGRALWAAGAALVDVGGESTRPGFKAVSADEEWRRVQPVVAALVADGIAVSIDTMKAEVARAALAAGAVAVNDVWGLQHDPGMAAVAAGADHVFLTHNRRTVDPALDLWADIGTFIERSLALARAAGVHDDRIVLDPGFGFGKTPEQNLRLIAELDRLKRFGFPVLVGASRKSTLGVVTGRPVRERVAASIGAHLAAAAKGAAWLRVHEVAEHRDALLCWHAALTGRTDG